jgi:GNAT superfamily N-acetyltransferase
MDLSIRRASAADADALFLLVKDFAVTFVPERSVFENSLREILANADANLSVAVLEGQVVGYCLGFDRYTFYANGRTSFVEEVMVREDLRKRGVGRQLLGCFEQWSVSRGSKLVGLFTRRAAPFYEAIGYESSGTFFRRLL